MRLFFCLFLSLSLNVLYAQDIPGISIDENFRKVPLSKVIRVLKNKYDVKVAYDDALVTGIIINGSYKNIPLTDFLDRILPDQGIDYQLLNGKIILTPKQVDLALDKPSLFDLTIYGVVTDSQTGETLPNALVRVAGSAVGTVTNSDGYFSLPKVPTDTSTIVVSYLGYQLNDIRLVPGRTRETLRIRMNQSVQSLSTFTVEDDAGNDKISYGEDISQITINPQSLSGLPSLGELDVFRSLQLLPGISGSGENASGLAIRSSPAAQNLILFDQFPIYRLDHFFGVFSAINSDAVRDIQVLKGGYHARYGGRVSGVVDITGKTGNFNEPTYTFGVNLLSARLSINAPLNQGKGALHISARRSYTDIIRSRLFEKLYQLYGANQDVGQSNDIRPEFWFQDLHVKATYNVSARDILSISTYRGRDVLRAESDFQIPDEDFIYRYREDTDWGNNGLGLTWSRNWSSNYYSSLSISRSSYYLNSSFADEFITNDDSFRSVLENRNNEITDHQLNFNNEIDIGTKHDLELGLNVSRLRNFISIQDELDAGNPVEPLDDVGAIAAFYAADKINISRKLQATVGFRVATTDIIDEDFFGHRLSLSYRPLPPLQLKAATGRYFQIVNDVVWDDPRNRNQNFWLLAKDPDAMRDPSDFAVPRLQSDHYIAGAQYAKNGWLVDVEYYEKMVKGLLDVSLSYTSLLGDEPSIAEEQVSEGEGTVRGVDFLIQKNAGPYQGWFSYTLAEARNRFDNINNGERIRSREDQRHEFKLVQALSLKKWNLSATWVWGSGKVFYVPRVRFITDNTGQVVDYDLENNNKAVNPLPAYERVDFSIAYKFESPNSNGEIGITIFNMFDHYNIQSRELDLAQIDADIALGRSPSIGYRDLQLLDFTPSFFFNLKF